MNNMKKSIYEEFARFFENPSRESLRDILKNNCGESSNCDYKGEWPKLDKIACHLLGMGNSGGGCIIFGVAETDNKSLLSKGLDTLLDKSSFFDGVRKYIPQKLFDNIDILDFPYNDSEYPKLIGKIFQVVFVEFDPEHLPFIAMADGKNIKINAIYTRRGPSTVEVTYEELQGIINRRIETGYSSQHEIVLESHIQQLKILYRQIDDFINPFRNLTDILSLVQIKGTEYKHFIDNMIKKKKKIIELELDVDNLT